MTHGARQAAVEAHATGADLDHLPRALFNGQARRLNAGTGKGCAGCACTCMPMAPWRMRDALYQSQYGSGGDFLGRLPWQPSKAMLSSASAS